jgi:hypothetical protein
MRTAWGALAALAVLAATGASAKKPGNGRGNNQGNDNDQGYSRSVVAAGFSSGDIRVIHEYYAGHPPNLPPGLRKKLARGGTLPPGWQKKIAPLPVDVERRLGPLPNPECRRGFIDGHAVIYNPRTSILIDVVFAR